MSGMTDQELRVAIRQQNIRDMEEHKQKLRELEAELQTYRFRYHISENDMDGIVSIVRGVDKERYLMMIAQVALRNG